MALTRAARTTTTWCVSKSNSCIDTRRFRLQAERLRWPKVRRAVRRRELERSSSVGRPLVLVRDELRSRTSAQRWDTQHLAGIDPVGVGQHRPVGLEDDVILSAVALAVFPLGKRPEGVAALDRIELRFRRGCSRLDV